jgi:hypothetical protein
MAETTERLYLSCADTAKLLRAHLRREFPGVKFSVRSSTYAGGASIDVGWTDGPAAADVDQVAGTYAGARFDGMIDLASYVEHWLEDDGTVTVAHDGGTEGSRGVRPESFGSRRTPGARMVHLGADYVHTSRQLSAGFVAACGLEVLPNGTFGDARAERCDGCGNWPHGDAACFVARVNDDRGVRLVCSAECGGRLIARFRAG